LAAGNGSNNQQIAAALKIPPVTVGKWRQSLPFTESRDCVMRPVLDGLPNAMPTSATRRQRAFVRNPKIKPLDGAYARGGTRISTVHAMLVAAKLQPHRIRTFTFSPDPDFEAKLLDIIDYI
jgi:hypothetical protein